MRFNWFFALVLLMSSAAVASPQKEGEFIGYRHKGVLYGEILPNGVRDLGGGLLSNGDYGVSRFVKGKTFMLWLEKITGRYDEGVPSWIVKDVLKFDNLGKNREFLFSYSSGCTQHGKENLDLVVMAEFNPKRKTYKVLRAWWANTKTEKFEKVSAAGIVCRYDEP